MEITYQDLLKPSAELLLAVNRNRSGSGAEVQRGAKLRRRCAALIQEAERITNATVLGDRVRELLGAAPGHDECARITMAARAKSEAASAAPRVDADVAARLASVEASIMEMRACVSAMDARLQALCAAWQVSSP